MGNKKICGNPECQKPLRKKPREGKHNFNKRKTCDKHCSNRSRMLNYNVHGVRVGKQRKFTSSKYPLSMASSKCIHYECGYIVESRCPWYSGTSDTSYIWRTRGVCPFYKWSIEDD
jgi:hypothetical protein